MHGKTFIDALVSSGIVPEADRVRRVVIDARATDVVVLHIERYGDERLLDLIQGPNGIDVRTVAAIDGDTLRGCPVEAWDGPYQYRCGQGAVGNVCATHGPFTPAKRCNLMPGCTRPTGHGGLCDVRAVKPE